MRADRRAALFDLDGVLVDSGPSVERAWGRWAKRRDLDPAAVLAVAHGRRTSDTIREVAPHLPAAPEAHELEQLAIAEAHHERALPGAADLLAQLDADTWAVVTSGTRELATARLRGAGLPLPGVLVAAEDVVHGKPDPEGYLRAADRLGAAPEQCFVIEDSPAGIAAARAAGMTAIGLTSTHSAEDLRAAHLIVTSLDEVRDVLGQR